MEDSQAAAALSAQLAQRLGQQRFDPWFKTDAQLHVHGSCLTIQATSNFVLDCLRKQFADEIRACWTTVVGHPGTVEFEVCATAAPACTKPTPCKSDSCVAEKTVDNAIVTAVKSKAHPNPSTVETSASRSVFDLASFVMGPSNEYAFRAAELTGHGRQQASPLLFCGLTGVGKTHLLKAIVREYRRHHPRAAAVYLSAEQFTTGFVEALRGSGLPSFRQKCRGTRLLAVDDLQFFAGKQRTLEELLHTFDTMAAEGRQLILASDRGLSELRALGPEMLSRLSGGLICEIEPPEFATRLGILRQLRDQAGLTIEDAVLSIVATQITSGARELQGALHRLEAMSLAYNEPISRELACRALADLARHNTRAVRLADVQKAVCDVFGVEPSQLRSERKGRSISEPRSIAMWLARKHTRAAWSEIGQYFGRRSHSTVISANRRVEKLITTRAQIGVADRTFNVEEAIRQLENALRTA
jgi:chromosomal replication initiator protein